MSAGRLRVFDKRASPKDRASRVLVRLTDGRELRLRELGTCPQEQTGGRVLKDRRLSKLLK